LHRTYPCTDARSTPPEAEHDVARFLEDDDFGVGLCHAEPVEGGLERFGDGLPGCLNPLHR
jgi:hypothetical protein